MISLQEKYEKILYGKKILCVVDEESSNITSYRQWVAAQIRQFAMHGAEIELLHPSGRLDSLPGEYRDLDADLIVTSPIEADDASERGPLMAQLGVKFGASDEFDVVVGFGWTVSRGIAGGRKLAGKFWAVVDDFTEDFDRSNWTKTSTVEALFAGCRKVFVFSEEKRSLLEGATPVANGRTYLPLMCQPIIPRTLNRLSDSDGEILDVYLPGLVHPHQYVDRLSEISEISKSPDSSLALHFDGDEQLWKTLQMSRDTAVLSAIPALKFSKPHAEPRLGNMAVGLVPDHIAEPWLVEYLVSNYTARGIAPVSMERFIKRIVEENTTPTNPVRELEALGFSEDSIRAINLKNRVRIMDAFGSRSNDSVGRHPLRVVLAGADFKFAGDLVELLNDSSAIDLRIDLWDNNAQPNPDRSGPFLDWADLIICEFSSFNAIWYSQNKRPGQRLIVRLHGYELLQPWIEQLDFQQVDKVVFVSEFYRQKAIDSMGWSASKTRVISNTVDFSDLARPKLEGSEFHLGMAGLVPILKRPDRALDLLEILVREDNRFVLHLRGHSPWNYGWEWKKQAHQAAYRKFYSRIGDSELLRSHIAFEQFGPDMAGWFRKIGWVLSPSFRETFHLAPVEGMASGSLPIVWDRLGASDIFPPEHVFGDTNAAAGFILDAVHDKDRLLRLSQGVQGFATQYSRSNVNEAWLGLLLDDSSKPSNMAVSLPLADLNLEDLVEAHAHVGSDASLLSAVSEAWFQREYATAISLLDENISLTANDSGDLKQWENWVRGVFQSASNLESMVPPSSAGCVYQPKAGRIARIVGHHKDKRPDWLRPLCPEIEEVMIGVGLPKPALGPAQEAYDFDATDTNFYRVIQFDGSLRANHYVSQVASELASEFRNGSVSLAVSTGGLIESFATMLAARRVGIPFIWGPGKNAEAIDFLSRFDSTLNDNPVHSIYQSVLKNSDGLIGTGEASDVSIRLRTGLPIITDFTSDILNDLYHVYESKNDDTSSLLRIIYVGHGGALESLRTVGEVAVVEPWSIAHELESVPDALVFDYGKVGVSREGGLTDSTSLMAKENLKSSLTAIVQARLMGVRTIFISSSDPTTLNSGKDLARRCDVVASNDRNSLISYMRLNPNSNQVNINVSGSMDAQVMPLIRGASTPGVVACYDDVNEGKHRAAALAEGRPFLSCWPKDHRWNDTKEPRSDYQVLRYEQDPSPEARIRALWGNCFELAQGRTAHDFATYLMRSAGFACRRNGSVSIRDLMSAGQAHAGEIMLGNTVVRINNNAQFDQEIFRDVVSLCRVIDAESIDVVSVADGHQTLTVLDVRKTTHVFERVSSLEDMDLSNPPSLHEFSAKGISVILATCLGANRISTMLDSIARQTLPRALVELIIVPNGPDDGTVELLESWAEANHYQGMVIAPQKATGVGNARNAGIALATKEFITFVDDDDFLESNFLLALYTRSSESTIVVGRLSDVDERSREVDRLTLTTNRVNDLNGRVLPLDRYAGALSMNGARLIPTELLRESNYDPNLKSGEDVAFMSQLLTKPDVYVTSASSLAESSYMRVLRSNSISRRVEDYQFMIIERLEVIKSLVGTREHCSTKDGPGAIDELIAGQLGFIKRYVADISVPEELQRVLDAMDCRGLTDNLVLRPLIAQLRSGIDRPESLTIGRRVSINT